MAFVNEMSGLVPPELLAWADIPLILLCIGISQVLRPVFDPEQGTYKPWQEWFRGDRILILPLAIGFIIGCLIEATTSTFDANMAIRRTLTTGCGAAVGFRMAKIFFPSLFSVKKEEPK